FGLFQHLRQSRVILRRKCVPGSVGVLAIYGTGDAYPDTILGPRAEQDTADFHAATWDGVKRLDRIQPELFQRRDRTLDAIGTLRRLPYRHGLRYVSPLHCQPQPIVRCSFKTRPEGSASPNIRPKLRSSRPSSPS